MTNKVLLARPNSFIVKNMKMLLAEMNFEPVVVKNIDELKIYKNLGISGIIISTGVSSVVKMTYADSITYSLAAYPGRPIILASLIDVELVLTNLKNKFELDFLTLDNLDPKKFNPYKQLVLISKKDIVDDFAIAASKLGSLLHTQYG